MKTRTLEEVRVSQTTAPLRVLILEDSPHDVELMLFELKEAGVLMEQTVAENAEQFRRAIQEQTEHVAGSGSLSLAGKAADFQRLALDREFADKMLASAMNTLEQARNEAQRKQLYLERISQPNLPDIAIEPRRFRSVLATFAVGMVLWGVLIMLLAGVREHID